MAKPWGEVRAQMLARDDLTLEELERRRRGMRWVKRGIWLLPVVVIGVVPTVAVEGLSWPVAVAVGLIAYGSISFYLLGARWERRWEELIAEVRDRRR